MRKKIAQIVLTKPSKIVLLIHLFLVAVGIRAQSPVYSFAQSSGTYAAITGGTVYSSGGSMDDASIPFTIPFTFTFNTTPYTSGHANENGYISFGSTVPNSSTRRVISNAQTGFQAAAPFAQDLGGLNGSSEMRGEILGSAPNRTFVVQWSNMVEYLGDFASFNFQVRISEGGGVEANQKIEFVYGNCTNTWADLSPQVGLRGLNNTQFINRTSTGTSWLTNTAGTGNNDGCFFSSTNPSIAPVSGLTFIWSRMYPVVTYTGSLSSFITCSGTASPTQTLAVSGSSLAANILITAPSGMEVSSTSPTAGFSNAVTLARSNFTVAPTTLYLRIASTASGTISDNVTISSFGATTQSIAVTGTVNNCSPAAALNFDGVNDYVNVSYAETTTNVTHEFWFKTTQGNQGLFAITDAGVSSFDRDLYLTGGNINAYVWQNTSSETIVTSGTNYADGNWHHVAHVVGASAGGQKLYVDGVLKASGVASFSAFNWNTQVLIGYSPASPSNKYFNGSMDEVRVWNVARTQCEINTYKNCEIPSTAVGLAANYHFNQGFDGQSNSGLTSLTDASGNSRTGALTGFALTGTVSNWVAPGGVTSGSVTPANLAITVGSTPSNSAICIGKSIALNGTGANTYVWTGGVLNGVSFSPTVTATYTVTGTNTVTGCSNTAVSTVTVNTLPSITTSVTNILCNGSTGSATVTATGGSSPYSYLASNGSTLSAQSNLMPGTYSYTVTDNNGCTNTQALLITEPSAIVTASAVTNILCNGGTGSATVTATGGTSPYSYLASNGATVSPQSGLMAGTYVYTVTDNNGCVKTQALSITEPSAINLSANASNATICAGSSTTLTANATGGTGTYTYTWVSGPVSNVNSVTPTSSSIYTVEASDLNNCTTASTVGIEVNSLPTISVNSGAICVWQSFTMAPSGAITYTYSNGSDVVSPTIDATYSVSGTDANGCVSSNTAISTVTVNNLPVLVATTNNTLLCTGQTATLSVSGASTYTWNTNETTNDISVTPTVQTTYTVNGTDANGCSNTTTIMQDVSVCTGIVALSKDNTSIALYPNPNNGMFAIELSSISNVIVTNSLGQILINESFDSGIYNIDIQGHSAGIYFVKVIENNQQKTIKVIKQ